MPQSKTVHINKAAEKRVKDATPIPAQCRYCEGPVELVENSEIYKRNYGKWPYAYLCRPCDAYVGLHPGTLIPLGSLANRDLRHARKVSKELFYTFMRDLELTRAQGYSRLSKAMGLPGKYCHFGMFEEDQCHLAVEKIQELYITIQEEQEATN